MKVCARCGREYNHGSRSWDDERKQCVNTGACSKRSTARMLDRTVQRPFVGGFDPDRAYRDAPKIGDGR